MDNGGAVAREPSRRIRIVCVEGVEDASATCGGRKPGGSHAWIVGRRSTGSRAISACNRAPTRAPEASRSPHSSSVHLSPATLRITYAAAVMPSSAMKNCSWRAFAAPRPASNRFA